MTRTISGLWRQRPSLVHPLFRSETGDAMMRTQPSTMSSRGKRSDEGSSPSRRQRPVQRASIQRVVPSAALGLTGREGGRQAGSVIALCFVALLATGCASTPEAIPDQPLALITRAEATDYRETSTHADVIAFLDALPARDDLHIGAFGESGEGRTLPLAVWGAGGASPEAIRASGKTRVLVFANIHAGEVAGKEAALMLLRDLASGAHAEWADQLGRHDCADL